jgi:hypothetical protein
MYIMKALITEMPNHNPNHSLRLNTTPLATVTSSTDLHIQASVQSPI